MRARAQALSLNLSKSIIRRACAYAAMRNVPVCDVQYAMCIMQCACVCNMRCAICNVQYAMFIVQCTCVCNVSGQSSGLRDPRLCNLSLYSFPPSSPLPSHNWRNFAIHVNTNTATVYNLFLFSL